MGLRYRRVAVTVWRLGFKFYPGTYTLICLSLGANPLFLEHSLLSQVKARLGLSEKLGAYQTFPGVAREMKLLISMPFQLCLFPGSWDFTHTCAVHASHLLEGNYSFPLLTAEDPNYTHHPLHYQLQQIHSLPPGAIKTVTAS